MPYTVSTAALQKNAASLVLKMIKQQTEHPGLRINYNHDLDVSEAFLESHLAIKDALKDTRLLDSFRFYDAQARANKRMFHLLGVGSLFLGLSSLIAAALAIIMGHPLLHGLELPAAAADIGSFIAVVLITWNRIGRYRVSWCQAMFCRERLRQWHFQKFLDGELIGLLITDRVRYQAELEKRWADLSQNLMDGYGMMTSFVRHGSNESDLFHNATPYEDESLAELVLTALWTLRIEHQLRYGQRKTEREPEQAGLDLEERSSISESVATMSLAAAIIVGAIGFIVSLVPMFPSKLFLWDPADTSRCLGGVSLLLTVLSAASRAYRTGYTLPDESESYEEYCDRIREYRAIFKIAPRGAEKLSQMREVEQQGVEELRRFLRMKIRATFIL